MNAEPSLFDFAEKEPAYSERQVGPWVFKQGVPIERDKQERHHAQAQRPDFHFDKLLPRECFDVRPSDLGEDDLLRTANIVSSAASSYKRRAKQGGKIVDFKTAQIGGRFVRCWRTI